MSRSPRPNWFFRGFQAESLGALRVVLAAGYLLYQITQFYPFLELAVGPSWYFLEPMWYMRWLGLTRVHPVLCWAVFAFSLAATWCVMVGRFTRPALVGVLLSMTFLKGVRDSVVGDTHHRLTIWWMVMLFLLVSESHRVFSPGRKGAKGTAIPEWQASWPIRGMQLYVVSFYFWSGVAKLRVSGADWWQGGGKLREVLLNRSAMWGLDAAGEPLGNPLAYALAGRPEWLEVLGVLVVGMELALPLVLLVTNVRLRVALLAVVAGFHAANFVLLYVGFLLMPLVFVVFFDMAPVLVRLRAWRQGRGRNSEAGTPPLSCPLKSN